MYVSHAHNSSPLVEGQCDHMYGATRDLMILFGERALQLARSDCGVMSMIFNDSIFTSVVISQTYFANRSLRFPAFAK